MFLACSPNSPLMQSPPPGPEPSARWSCCCVPSQVTFVAGRSSTSPVSARAAPAGSATTKAPPTISAFVLVNISVSFRWFVPITCLNQTAPALSHPRRECEASMKPCETHPGCLSPCEPANPLAQSAAGSVSVKVDPVPGPSEIAMMSPPWARARVRAMWSPIPVPPSVRRVKRWKIVSS